MPRVTIEILSNVRARVTGAPKATLRHLDEQLAEVQKGSEWAPNHRRFGGRWDGKRHHFHISPTFDGIGTFPKGLLSRVVRIVKLLGGKPKIVDLRKRILPSIDTSTVHADMLHGVSMSGIYSYQLEAVRTALIAQSGVLFMATNAGKSEIATAMIKVLDKHTVLFVVPKAILLKQTRERIAERLGTIPENIGVIGGGRFEPKDITIAIINSVTPAKRAKSARAKKRNEVLREYLATIDVVFLDEGHHAKAATWFRLMSALPNAQFRYLMSGTPFTGDNDLMVEAATGPVIYEIRNDALIKLGVSAKPVVRVISITKPDLDKEDDQTWDGVYKAGIVNNVYRNKIIARVADEYAAAGKAVLVLIRHLNQGSAIRQLSKSPVEFVHGKMPDSERDRLVAWFESCADGRVLIASSIFDEGVDIPLINAIVVADGGQSLRAVLQKIGRSIRRKKTGLNVVDAVDFADSTHKWLAKHSLERMDIYAGESFEIIEEEANGKIGSRSVSGNGNEVVSPVPGQADGRSEFSRWSGNASGELEASAEFGEAEFQARGAIVLWRWRQASRLD